MYNILCIINCAWTELCQARVEVARAASRKLEAWYGFGKLLYNVIRYISSTDTSTELFMCPAPVELLGLPTTVTGWKHSWMHNSYFACFFSYFFSILLWPGIILPYRQVLVRTALRFKNIENLLLSINLQ